MSNVDVVRDAPVKPQLPADPNVHIPESVKRAAAIADAYYTPQDGTPPTVTPVEPVVATPAEPVVEPVVPPTPKPKKPAKPVASAASEPVVEPVVPPVAPVAEPPVGEEQWEHRYRSMKGRYDATQGIMAQMQEQMSLMANELTRTQSLLQQQPVTPQQVQSLVTEDDRKNYGDDLIDLTRRIAKDTVEPELTSVKEENKRLQQRIVQQAQRGVIETLDDQLPDWREINNSPRFKQWLSLPDIYSGVVRKKMLDAAYQAASAPRVLAFFKGFITDEVATGNIEPPAAAQQSTPAPRQAAVVLEQIAAPGRARPASGGNTPAPANDQPIFTRPQVAKFYSDVRAGVYSGRDAEKNAYEQAIFLAQREGRIR
jgi:hypothetical protein